MRDCTFGVASGSARSYAIDVDPYERAVELAAYVSSEPGPGGTPLYEWIQIRQIIEAPPVSAG